MASMESELQTLVALRTDMVQCVPSDKPKVADFALLKLQSLDLEIDVLRAKIDSKRSKRSEYFNGDILL